MNGIENPNNNEAITLMSKNQISKYHSDRIGKHHYIILADHIQKNYKKLTEKDLMNVIDIGCSVGELLHNIQCPPLSKKGVDVCGEVGSVVVEREMVFHHLDLEMSQSFSNNETFDCLISMEVAEHVNNWRNYLDFVQSKSHKDSILFFSAAPPGQAGRNHVNLQEKPWWIKRFKHRGWKYLENETREMLKPIDKKTIPSYYYNNLMIFRREK